MTNPIEEPLLDPVTYESINAKEEEIKDDANGLSMILKYKKYHIPLFLVAIGCIAFGTISMYDQHHHEAAEDTVFTPSSRVEEGLSLARAVSPKEDSKFYLVPVEKGVCCGFPGPKTCQLTFVSDCNGEESTFYARPSYDQDVGVCSFEGSYWWTNSKGCYNGVPIPDDAHERMSTMKRAYVSENYEDHDGLAIQEKEEGSCGKCTSGRCGGIFSRPCCPCLVCREDYQMGPRPGQSMMVCMQPVEGWNLGEDDCDGNKCGSGDRDGICFSRNTLVNVSGKGAVPINQVKVGDFIQSKEDGTYSKVWGMEKNDDKNSQFRQLRTKSGNVLELTDRHMVYLKNKALPIPARQVQVGDVLKTDIEYEDSINAGEVVRIQIINRRGFYNALTFDGTVVADKITSSVFSAGLEDASMFFDKTNIIHWHTLSQVATAPLRLTCKAVWFGFCSREEFLNKEGLHKFIILLKNARSRPKWQQYLLLPLILSHGLFFSLLELVYDNFIVSPGVPTVAVMGTIFAATVPLSFGGYQKKMPTDTKLL